MEGLVASWEGLAARWKGLGASGKGLGASQEKEREEKRKNNGVFLVNDDTIEHRSLRDRCPKKEKGVGLNTEGAGGPLKELEVPRRPQWRTSRENRSSFRTDPPPKSAQKAG